MKVLYGIGFAVVIILFVAFLLRGTELITGITELITSIIKGPVDNKFKDAPTVYCKVGRKYVPHIVNKAEYTIGSASNSDLVIDDELVAKKQAVIKRIQEGTDIYYEFVNLVKAKNGNPTEYYSKESAEFEYMNYNEGIELEEREIFVVGNTKLAINLPRTNEVDPSTGPAPVRKHSDNDSNHDRMPSGRRETAKERDL